MQVKQSDFKKLTILYAEDDVNVLEDIGYVLKAYFKEVYLAKDGEEALELYETKYPDIVLSDIRMPKLDGLALAKEINRLNKETPVIMITAFSDEKTLLQAVRLYLEDYIVKPLSHGKLIDALTRCVKRILKEQQHEYAFSNSAQYSFDKKIVTVNGKEVALTHYEIEFLELLISHQGGAVSYEEIETHVWKEKVMSKDAIKTLVKKLRNKLPPETIKNIVGFGYKLP